ncbi:MAG: Fic family protein [Ignavibacteriaceae bacterium]|nr:Fic family protein [Ignavibacteriaceae bacterium]
MNYLSIEEILFIHYRLLVELQPNNDNFNVLNPDSLEAAVARPRQSVNGEDAYPDLFSKAAALTESLIKDHPFTDGNKRVGITAGCVLLTNNGFNANANNDDVYLAAIKIASGDWEYRDIKSWFEKYFYN